MTHNNTFLEHVAQDIIARFGTNLATTAVVFPNKRASLFMNEYLTSIADKPIWSPAYITISDLFRRHSSLEVADQIELICRLYAVYSKHVSMQGAAAEYSLDHFYGWGELLLADFDDLDKNMGDADKIFADLSSYQQLTTAPADMLDETQLAQLRRLFGYFAETDSELKARFNELWGKLPDIYHDFRNGLAKDGLAYEGMLYRNVAEEPDIDFRYDKYLFVGFNMMQQVEQQMCRRLKAQGKALFYWDFDHYYLDSKSCEAKSEAGIYIAKYLEQFPNALPSADDSLYNNIGKPKDITYISAQTDNIQAKLIPQWLEQKGRKEAGRHTAIVLADEKLLPTVVSNIPPGIPVNITTGYPLALSPAASLLNLLITLRTDGLRPDGCSFRLKAVSSLLTHPYIIYISDQAMKLRSKLLDERKYFPTCKELTIDEGTGLLFRQPAEPGDTAETITWMAEVMEFIGQHSGSNDDPFFQETIFRSFTLTNRIKLLSDRGLLDIKPQTLERLLSQIVSSTSVPFHGEPAEGVQVMGVLETRNLDFDHILFLSCNEGNMPKGVNDSSFIPYSIRKFYGLTTIDNKVAIYAYYFNRLIQRTTDITLTYNTTTEGTHTSEMSRFMLQMMVEGPHTISRESLLAGQTPMRTVQKAVSKTDDIIRKLLTPKKEAKLPSISPSALGMYLNCQLRFFFAHVVGLREDEDEEDEDIDARIFGNIFHSAAEFLYCGKIGRILQADDLRKLHKEVDSCVEKAFVKELFGQDPTTARLGRLNGLQEINSEVIKKYLHRLVEADMAKAPLTILATEKWVEREFSTMVGGKVVTCKFGGIIDRVDRTESDGKIRIVDYKTGRYPSSWPKTVEEIFDSERNTSIPANYYLQTMLYSSIVRAQNPQTPVVPALLYIQRASNKDYDPTLTFAKEPIGDISDYDDEFNQMLQQLVGEMFSTDIDFAPTTDRTRCERCPFAQLCY
ncbi:hypothetical protein CIL02_15885 [Prevotella sp. P3-122]|nr:hypothetical protein CIL02_15885 [Prevotella sp. P3-122]